MHGKFAIAIALSVLGITASACSDANIGSNVDDVVNAKYAEGSAEARAILAVANDKVIDEEMFDLVVGLHSKAAGNLVAWRDGQLDDPTDDNEFETLQQLVDIKYCKSSCLDALFDYAVETGVYTGKDTVSVIFSPQTGDKTHLQAIANAIDEHASETIDIAMYSYSHQEPVKGALLRALDRGVKIRFLANTDLANSNSKGGALEGIGIDVRRVTKIMHHKFAIIDGPRDNATLDRASSAYLISGSGNWSGSAASNYDENTLFLNGGFPELTLRLQRDFDTLWAGSKDVVYQDLSWDQTRGDITDALIAEVDQPSTHALLTSFNFAPTSSQGWSVLGTTVVSDALVQAIRGAQDSIKIASGHFVNEPIAQAVVDALTVNPDLEVDIVLDCQEVSKSGAISTLKSTAEQLGASFGYKCNTYRWHYKYAKQMHHKYMIIDDIDLYTGSYNMSLNAEINTFENMLVFKGAEHQALIDAYLTNHEMVKHYGHEDDGYALDALIADIETDDVVPLMWNTAITMSLATFQDLRNRIREQCPATQSWLDAPGADTYNTWFNKQPQWFAYCHKSGYPWPNVPEDLRVD